MASSTSRPVHPCHLSVFEGKSGVEYSTWAHITDHSTAVSSSTSSASSASTPSSPDLVTAHGNSLSIYRVDGENTGKLLLVHSYNNLAGNICFLETLRVDDYVYEKVQVEVDMSPPREEQSVDDKVPAENSTKTTLAAATTTTTTEAIDHLDVKKLKVAELKAELSKRSLSTDGLKASLALRLQSHLDQRQQQQEEEQQNDPPKPAAKQATAPTKQEASATHRSSKKRLKTIRFKRKKADVLLIGFSGHPRLAIVNIQPNLLLATTLLDLTPALTEKSYGATTPINEHELTACLLLRSEESRRATVAVVLGGGVALACLQLKYFYPSCSHEPAGSSGGAAHGGGWRAIDEPYILPLSTLAKSLVEKSTLASTIGKGVNVQPQHQRDAGSTSIFTCFGDILGTAFLPSYLEPTMVVLHSNSRVGRAWPGRLGREEGTGTRNMMVLTAITVTVGHQRSAILWSTEVPADALNVKSLPSAISQSSRHGPTVGSNGGGGGCLVQCVNSIVFMSNTGQVLQCLAVNGWARSTLSAHYSNLVSPNPWPFPKLAIQLDGAQFAVVNERAWFVILRRGQVYLLQQSLSSASAPISTSYHVSSGAWSLLPLYQTIGAVGEVSHVCCKPMGLMSTAAAAAAAAHSSGKKAMVLLDLLSSIKDTDDKDKGGGMEMGLLFVASRLGDSSLLGYALDETSLAEALQSELGLVSSGLNKQDALKSAGPSGEVTCEHDRILRLEEEALYAMDDVDGTGSLSGLVDVVPPSDDEETMLVAKYGAIQPGRKRARLIRLIVVRCFSFFDSLTSMGPLGPACMGPLAPGPKVVMDPTMSNASAAPVVGTTGYIMPCGYGSSGGLALLSMPGRDDRTIMAEADCVNGKALLSIPHRRLVFLVMDPENGGTKPMRMESAPSSDGTSESTQSLVELDLATWCPNEDTRDFFENCKMLAASDLTNDSFVILAASPINQHSNSYFFVVLKEENGCVRMTAANQLSVLDEELITSATMVHDAAANLVLFACILSSGYSKVLCISSDGLLHLKGTFAKSAPMDLDDDITDEEKFFADGKIVAVDIFQAPCAFFAPTVPVKREANDVTMENSRMNCDAIEIDYLLGDDDKDLYADMNDNKNGWSDTIDAGEIPTPDGAEVWYYAHCRQSGVIDIYLLSDLSQVVWSSQGCGHGVPTLQTDFPVGSPYRVPKIHKTCTAEMKFFFCGPSSTNLDLPYTGPRPFCFLVETNDCDTHAYVADIHFKTLGVKSFTRISRKDVSRPSKESEKHFFKLKRKKIVRANASAETPATEFRHRRLCSFYNVSGQDGCFASVARPFWIISERGSPTFLYHRCRHVAPAGARSRPVTGFCSGLSLPSRKESGFVTLHERVGSVGSQRLTLFDGILNLASPHSLLPGGGLFVEKIPFGVTVHKILFIDDGHEQSGMHPLYSVLVSREYEEDLSHLNDDGLTDDERQAIAGEKEQKRIQRQVEADLGGFDIEQDWVEDIEREDKFKVDVTLGGASPIQRSAYSLWIVDAGNGWQVVDSHELDQDDVGMTMCVLALSDFGEEAGADRSGEDLDTKLVIALGTAIVDKNGEDVTSKGRTLLFEIVRSQEQSPLQVAVLNLLYEKVINHGGVISLSCLSSEGRNRLIIGAGADVNVEQWGANVLTQVGFYRATMQIVSIKHFKNFWILSDAYDSLYFLVWRESDKSLTLLAKDYDPIPVYAAGIMSRGGSLDFVCADDRENLQFFSYAPRDPAARGGNRLVLRADFHLGSQTTDMPSHFCRSSLLINSATPSSTLAALSQQDTFFVKSEDYQKLGVSFGTTEGGYGSVIPVSEPIYWRLMALQSVLVNALESDCALSHRAFRLYRRTPRRGGCRQNVRKKGVIDGDLVLKYADLSRAEQEDLASAIGSTVDVILDNLLELRCSSMVL